MTANPGASVLVRLLTLSRQRGDDYNLLLNRFALERLLCRVAASEHADDEAKRRQWQAFANKSRLANVTGTLPETIDLIHALLWPATQVAGSSSDATALWMASQTRWR